MIEFDGVGAITMNKVKRVEISGFEIIGPNDKITKIQAENDRLLHSKKFSGRGIAIWSGSHIRIENNIVHGCPNSGIRINKGDYCAIENNKVQSHFNRILQWAYFMKQNLRLGRLGLVGQFKSSIISCNFEYLFLVEFSLD